MIRTILLSVSACVLLTSAAVAGPINAADVGQSAISDIEQVRMICDQSGRCWRSRGPRYVQRGYDGDDGYVVRRSYNSYGRYDRPGYGYGGGPSIGFSFGNRGW
jgi:hypothetical protein